MLFKFYRIHCSTCEKDRMFSQHVDENALSDVFIAACPDCGGPASKRRIATMNRGPSECLVMIDTRPE